VVSGLGMILLTQWGRWLAIKWGKIIVWVLPIAFGLSTNGLSDFFSLAFAVIIIIGLYAVTIATNLEQPEFDIAFEPAHPEETAGKSTSDNEDQGAQPAIQKDGAAPEKIRFECKKCGKQYAVRTSLVGKKATCKECGHKFKIPAESTR
jgi:DNA-directed RNA polymerase subunit RPC12/RpoP